MLTILNLRAGNGGGKSTVYRWLIDNHDHEGINWPNWRTGQIRKPPLWRLHGDLFLIGRYTSGADGISFASLIDQVVSLSRYGSVMFENVMVSANISTWLPIRRSLPEIDWIWATLDTPEEVCIERIYNRNGGKPVKEQPIRLHHRRVKRHHDALLAEGEHAVMIDHTRAIEQVHDLLVAGGWDCGHDNH